MILTKATAKTPRFWPPRAFFSFGAVFLLGPLLMAACSSSGAQLSREEELWPSLSRPTWEAMTVAELNTLLEQHDARERDPVSGTTALIAAAEFNTDPEVTALLIAAGTDLEARNSKGATAFMVAARSNPNPAVVGVLFNARRVCQTR